MSYKSLNNEVFNENKANSVWAAAEQIVSLEL